MLLPTSHQPGSWVVPTAGWTKQQRKPFLSLLGIEGWFAPLQFCPTRLACRVKINSLVPSAGKSVSSIKTTEWAANCSSSSQNTPYFMEPQVHHSPPLVPMSQMNPVHHIPFIYDFNIVFYLRLGLTTGVFPSGFPTKTLFLRHTCHTP